MNIAQRIESLALLGRFMAQTDEPDEDPQLARINDYFYDAYQVAIGEARLFNGWFSEENVKFALANWAELLELNKLQQWLENYQYKIPKQPRTVAIIMAGNIPLVGFHDLLCVLIAGHRALVKPSSDDEKLIPFLMQVLVAIDKRWAKFMELAEGKLSDFDAVIATGSDNSARYFNYYFGKYPHIIRKNRSSVAVLNGQETKEELKAFGEDVFRYYGLGCRNVSKAYVQEDFDVNRLFEAFYDFQKVAENKKYANNYDYNRAIYLMEKKDFLDNGFFIIREHDDWHAPVAVLHLKRFREIEKAEKEIDRARDEIQCLVGNEALSFTEVPFGHSQKPALDDYADRVDTMEFLLRLSK